MTDDPRIRQQCRRGMLELDRGLTRYLETRYVDLDSEMQAVFGRLLDQDDRVLFDWLMGTSEMSTEVPEEFRFLVDAIQSTR